MKKNNIRASKLANPNNEREVSALEQMFQASIPGELRQLLILYDMVEFERKEFHRHATSSFLQEMTLERIMGAAKIIEAHG